MKDTVLTTANQQLIEHYSDPYWVCNEASLFRVKADDPGGSGCGAYSNGEYLTHSLPFGYKNGDGHGEGVDNGG